MFKAEPLRYDYNALEPFIDARTMDIHYNKHYMKYLKNLNEAILEEGEDEENLYALLDNIEDYSQKMRNNLGGYYNHNLYWMAMTPNSGEPMTGLGKAIDHTFGSYDNFKAEFKKAGLDRFGSGWAWLTNTENGLVIHSTPNQDNPLMSYSEVYGDPIIPIDVWEHAYYLKHNADREAYIDAFFDVICWSTAEVNYLNSTSRTYKLLKFI
jgi:Fe-Mn family superoxide dismutase